MNSPLGKQILALVRDADYAHAGEEASIALTFAKIPKDPGRRMLDVGCGRGGTAHYLNANGWGDVTGVDIDAESIAYARRTYPDLTFREADVCTVSETLSERFDLIYLFNAYYAFPDHARALGQLRRLIRPGGLLVINDYTVKPGGHGKVPFADWHPIECEALPVLFAAAGWRLTETADISVNYFEWYDALVRRIVAKEEQIRELGGAEWFAYVRDFYTTLRDAVAKGIIGGAVVYAVAQ